MRHLKGSRMAIESSPSPVAILLAFDTSPVGGMPAGGMELPGTA